MAPTGKEIQVGYEIPSISKMLTLEVSQAYSGWPETRNFHTDPKIAQELGFPTVVMQGMLGAAYLSELCTNFFGESWFSGGSLALSFINPVFPTQRLVGRGVVREKTVEGNKVRLVLDVWLENEEGQKVQVGTASAELP